MKILVTGGVGYIGSHTVVELQKTGHEVIIVDNLSNSKIEVLDQIEKISGIKPECEIFNLEDRAKTKDFFRRHTDLEGIIHFAAYKAVGESVDFPLKYYRNNLVSLMNILENMKEFGVENLVFSSSCTVYGQPDELPVTEQAPIKPALSPYGYTKQVAEVMIRDFIYAHSAKSIALRYFNPIGAHSSGFIGELPTGIPNNLMPYLTQVASKNFEYLQILCYIPLK